MPTTPTLDVAGYGVTTMDVLSPSMLYSGKRMNIIQPSTTSANVGNLTGMPLYTKVSEALVAACTAIPPSGRHGSATNCGPNPTISNIIATNDEGNWYDDEELELEISSISYTNMESLHGMIASIASVLNGTSMNRKNIWTLEAAGVWGIEKGGLGVNGNELPPKQIANTLGYIYVSFTQDTVEFHDWPEQHLQLNLRNLRVPTSGEFTCADGALITDALAALALLPGLDFLAWLAAPALGVSATCAGLDGTE